MVIKNILITKNKRGWIRIVEAFVAILIVTGAALVLINKASVGDKSDSAAVREKERAVLHEIEFDDILRESVLKVPDASIPLSSIKTEFPQDVLARINQRIPKNLECNAKICALNVLCPSENTPQGKNIYVESVPIVATSEYYSPRQLSIFCWVR